MCQLFPRTWFEKNQCPCVILFLMYGRSIAKRQTSTLSRSLHPHLQTASEIIVPCTSTLALCTITCRRQTHLKVALHHSQCILHLHLHARCIHAWYFHAPTLSLYIHNCTFHPHMNDTRTYVRDGCQQCYPHISNSRTSLHDSVAKPVLNW